MKLKVELSIEEFDDADMELAEGETVESYVKDNFEELLSNGDIEISVDSVKEA